MCLLFRNHPVVPTGSKYVLLEDNLKEGTHQKDKTRDEDISIQSSKSTGFKTVVTC